MMLALYYICNYYFDVDYYFFIVFASCVFPVKKTTNVLSEKSQ